MHCCISNKSNLFMMVKVCVVLATLLEWAVYRRTVYQCATRDLFMLVKVCVDPVALLEWADNWRTVHQCVPDFLEQQFACFQFRSFTFSRPIVQPKFKPKLHYWFTHIRLYAKLYKSIARVRVSFFKYTHTYIYIYIYVCVCVCQLA